MATTGRQLGKCESHRAVRGLVPRVDAEASSKDGELVHSEAVAVETLLDARNGSVLSQGDGIAVTTAPSANSFPSTPNIWLPVTGTSCKKRSTGCSDPLEGVNGPADSSQHPSFVAKSQARNVRNEAIGGSYHSSVGKRAPPRIPRDLQLDTNAVVPGSNHRGTKDELKGKGNGQVKGPELSKVPSRSGGVDSCEDVVTQRMKGMGVASCERPRGESSRSAAKQSFLKTVEKELVAGRQATRSLVDVVLRQGSAENGHEGALEDGEGVEVGAGAWALGRSGRGPSPSLAPCYDASEPGQRGESKEAADKCYSGSGRASSDLVLGAEDGRGHAADASEVNRSAAETGSGAVTKDRSDVLAVVDKHSVAKLAGIGVQRLDAGRLNGDGQERAKAAGRVEETGKEEDGLCEEGTKESGMVGSGEEALEGLVLWRASEEGGALREKLIAQMKEENEQLAAEVAEGERRRLRKGEDAKGHDQVHGKECNGVATSSALHAHGTEGRTPPRHGHQNGLAWAQRDRYRMLEIDGRLENAERLWVGVELASDIAKYARQAEVDVKEEREARERAERERDEAEAAKWRLEELVARLEAEAGASERTLYEVDQARKVAEAHARSSLRRARKAEEVKASLAEALEREMQKRVAEREAASRLADNLAREMAARLATAEDTAHQLARREADELRSKEARLRLQLAAELAEANGLREKLQLLEVAKRRWEASEAEAAAHLRRVEAAERSAVVLRQALEEARGEARQAREEARAAGSSAHDRENEARQLCAIAVKLREVCSDQAATIDSLREGAAANERELAARADAIAESREKLRCAEARTAEVEQKLDEARLERTVLEARIRELQSRAVDGDFLREALQLAQQELETARQKAREGGGDEEAAVVREQAAALEEVRRVNRRLGGDVERLVTEVEGLRREGEEAREGLREREERERVEGEAEDLRRRLRAAEDNASNFQGEVARLQGTVGLADAEVRKWETEAREARASQVEMVQKLKDSAQRLFEASEQAEALETALRDRRARVAELEARDALHEEVSGAMEEALARLEERGAALRERVAEVEGMNRELLLLQDGARAEIASVAAELAASKADLDMAREEVRGLREEAAAREMHCSLLTERLSAVEAELSRQRASASLAGDEEREAWDEEALTLRRALTEARRLKLAAEQDAAVGREVVKEVQKRVEALTSKASSLEEELRDTKGALEQKDREAEERKREALEGRLVAEELRAKVQRLEEELLEKEGQIAILYGPMSP